MKWCWIVREGILWTWFQRGVDTISDFEFNYHLQFSSPPFFIAPCLTHCNLQYCTVTGYHLLSRPVSCHSLCRCSILCFKRGARERTIKSSYGLISAGHETTSTEWQGQSSHGPNIIFMETNDRYTHTLTGGGLLVIIPLLLQLLVAPVLPFISWSVRNTIQSTSERVFYVQNNQRPSQRPRDEWRGHSYMNMMAHEKQ